MITQSAGSRQWPTQDPVAHCSAAGHCLLPAPLHHTQWCGQNEKHSHTHTHTRLQRNETTKKMEKGKINHLPLRMMSTATEKNKQHAHKHVWNRAGKKTHKKQQKKLRAHKRKKNFAVGKLCGTERIERSALLGVTLTTVWLAGWLPGYPLPPGNFSSGNNWLTGQLARRDRLTTELSEFILFFFSVFFCSLFKRAYEWWWNKLTALVVVVVVVCSFGLVWIMYLINYPITNYQ